MPTTCAQEGECFVFEYLGFVTDGTSGQTTVTFRVTNKCKNATGYVAIGTNAFTRIAPANGGIYAGSLGTYKVSWTRATGKPGFVSVKFESRFDNFNNGASDVFSIVVSNFNPNTTIQVQGKAGFNEETFSFLLSQTTCSPPSVPGLSRWLGKSWNSLLAWFGQPQTRAFQGQGNQSQLRFASDSDFLPSPSRRRTPNWKWVTDAGASGESSNKGVP